MQRDGSDSSEEEGGLAPLETDYALEKILPGQRIRDKNGKLTSTTVGEI